MDAKPFSMTNGTKLVIGLVLAAILLVIGVQRYRQQDEVADVMQRQGPDAARQGMGLSQEGVKLLPPEERQELGALYETALQNLSAADKQRFTTLAKKGQAANDQEIAESSDLIQRALRTLPADKTERLLALVGKAVQLQLSQSKSAPPAEK
jgi:hypothetical protein